MIRLLERDFSMIMLTDLDNPAKVKEVKNSGCYKIWNARKIRVCKNNGAVMYAENRKAFNFLKTKISYAYSGKNVPKMISLSHRTIPLQVELKQLEQ